MGQGQKLYVEVLDGDLAARADDARARARRQVVRRSRSTDHLDRHGGMDGYIAAKKRVFKSQGQGDVAVFPDGVALAGEVQAEGLDHTEHDPEVGLDRSARGVQAVGEAGFRVDETFSCVTNAHKPRSPTRQRRDRPFGLVSIGTTFITPRDSIRLPTISFEPSHF